jgi:hypothetical protein
VVEARSAEFVIEMASRQLLAMAVFPLVGKSRLVESQ